MGNAYEKYIKNPEGMPTADTAPTFDPLYGFPNGRKPRVMVATEREMDLANLTAEERDYCAHELMKALRCRSEKWPFVYSCGPLRHKYQECQFQDYVLRMKEFEREKRLLRRRQRLNAQTADIEIKA